MGTQLPLPAPLQFSARVYCDQTAGWIKMPLGMEVDLGQGHIVLDGTPLPLPQKGAAPSIFGPCPLWPNGLKVHGPQFAAHAYCGQTAGWMKMPLGTEVDLSPDHTVLDGDPAPPREKGIAAPLFGTYLLWPRSPISATCLLIFHCHKIQTLLHITKK